MFLCLVPQIAPVAFFSLSDQNIELALKIFEHQLRVTFERLIKSLLKMFELLFLKFNLLSKMLIFSFQCYVGFVQAWAPNAVSLTVLHYMLSLCNGMRSATIFNAAKLQCLKMKIMFQSCFKETMSSWCFAVSAFTASYFWGRGGGMISAIAL